jgi:hypothetical protein
MAFYYIRLIGIRYLYAFSKHYYSAAMVLLAVAIRRYLDWITYYGSAVDDLSVVSIGVGKRPLKWVAGRRLRPAKE